MVLRRTLAQAEPVLVAAVSRVAARTLVVAIPVGRTPEVMMVMMMSLTTRPVGQRAFVQGIAREPIFCFFSLFCLVMWN